MLSNILSNMIAILLIIYHGVRMGTQEVNGITLDDNGCNKIHICGDHARTLQLTAEEIYYVNSLKEKITPDIISHTF